MADDDLADRFEKLVFESSDKQMLPYRFLKPTSPAPDQKYPLVVFLHGAGERGDDNVAPLIHGVKTFATDEYLEKYPCYVIVPQCPAEMKWVDVDWTLDASTMPADPTPPMRSTQELIDKLIADFPVDANRLYVTGLSMGGFGTWDAIQRYPEKFAAAVPVCGGGDPARVEPCANIPVWAFHGAKDSAVKVNRSREMIAAIKALGGKPRYTEYPEVGHDSWVPAYKTSELYEWMFAQSKSESQ
ncbi:MAG: prolyl oligopeptidase family serine peptidase [Planctomycetota bacterium]|nr:prolyl oligopeptidase family serine peptidase [Planctomycetota bacterium]MDA1213530.1 prolyl oligopeptidase family serine peptidase [Planctomycetota bacterium]